MIIELVVGMLLVVVVLYDVFETIVVPRRTDTKWRLAPPVIFGLWPLWQRIGLRLSDQNRRENFLGTFAPFVIVLMLLIWVLTLVLGYGLVFYALRDEFEPALADRLSAIYVAGTALLTIGFGDYVPTYFLARALSLCAGASGMIVTALAISLTFNLYGSFSRREMLVLLLDSRAGVPPSGLTLLESHAERRIIPQLGQLFNQYELWVADLLDSHLSYPILPFFRSSHAGQSWISALGAVLDASVLLTTAVEAPSAEARDEQRACRAAAEMFYHLGCHALVDLTHFPGIRRLPQFTADPGIERSEFDEACRRLQAAGYPVRFTEEAWAEFVEQRSIYATRLNAIARFLASPPTLWIGDRSIVKQRSLWFAEH